MTLQGRMGEVGHGNFYTRHHLLKKDKL